MHTLSIRLIIIFIFFHLTQVPYAISKETTLPFFTASDLTPYWEADHTTPSKLAPTPATLTPFQVFNQDGHSVSEKNLEGRVSLINFFFAECPGLCPIMMKSIQRFQRRLGALSKQVDIYSLSVQPEHDTPTRLREYAAHYMIELKHWSLLTGNRSQIYQLGRDVFKADGSVGSQKNESSFIHTRNVYLVDAQRRIRGIYDTEDTQAMRYLAKDIAQLTAH